MSQTTIRPAGYVPVNTGGVHLRLEVSGGGRVLGYYAISVARPVRVDVCHRLGHVLDDLCAERGVMSLLAASQVRKTKTDGSIAKLNRQAATQHAVIVHARTHEYMHTKQRNTHARTHTHTHTGKLDRKTAHTNAVCMHACTKTETWTHLDRDNLVTVLDGPVRTGFAAQRLDRSRITLCHHAVFRTSRFIKREKLVRHGLVHQQRLHLNK